MNKNNKSQIVAGIATVAFLTVSVAFIFVVMKPAAKLGWVNLPVVYDDFEYKKELEARLVEVQEVRKNIIDSLEIELRILAEEIHDEKNKNKSKIQYYQLKGEEYIQRKKQFEQDNYMNKAKYEEQVLNQLNQYVKDYGLENGYTFIYGADGSGALMYAEKGINITEDVKKYVNQKYKGIQ